MDKQLPLNTEQHLFVCLAEEASEVIKEIAKGMRFGFDTPHNGESPRQRLGHEVDHLVVLIDEMKMRGYLPRIDIANAEDKYRRLKLAMDESYRLGTLAPTPVTGAT